MDKITVKYSGVGIEYIESSDRWRFELDGRERHADTLKNAKAAIDAPPKTKKQPFQRFEAYKFDHWSSEGFVKVTVTSYAEPRSYSNHVSDAWITNAKGDREKVSLSILIKVTPANENLIEQWKEFGKQEREAHKQKEKISEKLERLEAPKDLTTDAS